MGIEGTLQRHSIEFLRRHGSPLLMWILIGVILASPIVDSHPRVGAAVAAVGLLSVLFGASLAGNPKIVSKVAIPLSGIWMLARLLEEFGDGRHPHNDLAHAAGLAVSCTLLWALFDRIRDPHQVTSSVIAEAIIVYLILAIAFSQVYWILNECVAHPFNETIASSDSTAFLYFSMVTMTAVGYGGILPVNPFVRLVAVFESMTGIFYIAVIVARIVASYHPQPKSGEDGSNLPPRARL